MKKLFLISLLAGLSLATVSCDNNGGLAKLQTVRHAGKCLYVEGAKSSSTYEIEDLNIKSRGALLDLGNYIYDANGQQYSIKNQGKTVGKIKLSPTNYAPTEIANVNINNLDSDQEVYFIDNDVKYIRFFTEDTNPSPRNLFINVMPRETSLEIEFDNVSIRSTGTPVLFNSSGADISLNLSNYVDLGVNEPLNYEESANVFKDMKYEAEQLAADYAAELGVLGLHAALTHATTVLLGKYSFTINTCPSFLGYAVVACMVAQASYVLCTQGVEGFEQETMDIITTFSNNLVNLEKTLLDSLNGKPGNDGMRGMDAIITTGGLSIKTTNKGTFKIKGGSGTNGTNATQGISFQNGAKGGDGGQGGDAIVAGTFINDSLLGSLTIQGGEGGLGGQGSKDMFDDNNGKNGPRGKDVNALHYFG